MPNDPDPNQIEDEEELQRRIDEQTDAEYAEIFRKKSYSPQKQAAPATPQEQGLVDELGIEDIYQPIVGAHGKVFCAAGRDAPLAVFEDDFLVLHPPQKPLTEDGPEETIQIRMTEEGLLLDELGNVKKLASAKYRGRPIFYFGEQLEGTSKHFVVVKDFDGSYHYIFDSSENERLTADQAYKYRNKSFTGEISIFPELSSTLDETSEPIDNLEAYSPDSVGIPEARLDKPENQEST